MGISPILGAKRHAVCFCRLGVLGFHTPHPFRELPYLMGAAAVRIARTLNPTGVFIRMELSS